MTREEFIDRATAAAREAKAAGAPINVPIAVAQKALESNFGASQLAVLANNLGGVKAGGSWSGPVIELPTREYRAADDTWYTTVARWRKYRDWAHSFEDYGDLIRRVYPFAAVAADEPRRFLEELVARDYPKYATDPDYVEKVWSVAERHGLLDPPGPARLLIVYGVDGAEVARVPLPEGVDVLLRASSDGTRYHVRPDVP